MRRFTEHKSKDKKGSKIFERKRPFNVDYEKEDWKQEYGGKVSANVKKLSKIRKEMLIEV